MLAPLEVVTFVMLVDTAENSHWEGLVRDGEKLFAFAVSNIGWKCECGVKLRHDDKGKGACVHLEAVHEAKFWEYVA